MQALQINRLTEQECNNILDTLPLAEKRLLVEVMTELKSARRKHPWWPLDVVHRAAVVAEESGELIRAALQAHHENGLWELMHREAVQTASTCLRFLAETPYSQEVFIKAAKQAVCHHRYEVTGESHNKKFYRCPLCEHETND